VRLFENQVDILSEGQLWKIADGGFYHDDGQSGKPKTTVWCEKFVNASGLRAEFWQVLCLRSDGESSQLT